MTPASVPRYFERVTESVERTIMHNGRVVRPFYYRFGYGYRPKKER